MTIQIKRPEVNIDPERSALLACIGLSLMIWFFVKLSKVYTTEKRVSIEYKLPPMMEFTNPPPSGLVATVSGSGIDLAKKFVFQRNPTIEIDLANISDPAVQRSELMSKIQEKTGLTVQNINRNYLSFSIDSTATKKVPVKLNVSLQFKTDYYQTGPLDLNYDSVLLAGPLQELNQINHAETEEKTIENIDGNVTTTVSLKGSGINNVTFNPQQVQLKIRAEQFTERIFEIPIEIQNAPVGIQLNPSKARVTCSVGLSRYNQLVDNSFSVVADFTGIQNLEEQKIIPLTLSKFPDWIKSPRISPAVVEFLKID
ncbi:MAG: YbbR-like domain-containing protein [Bacteroidota bacterium]